MLELRHIFCGYDAEDVIRNVSFSVAEGEVLCLLGPNGCGKTTLLKTIAGLIPYQGSIHWLGQEVRSLKRGQLAAGVALMSQISETYFEYSVYDTVMLGRYLHGKKGLLPSRTHEDEVKVKQALEEVELWPQRDQPITQLSGGQLQRVFLARTFVQEPKLILLDEPTNHLDLKYQLELMERLASWSKLPGRCVMGVFHDLNLAMQFAERVVILDQGKVAIQGPTGRVLQDSMIAKVFDVDVLNYMQSSLKKWLPPTEGNERR